MWADNLTRTIGNTPLVKLERYGHQNRLKAGLYAKLEYFNPGGSVKDRVGYALIEDAEKKNLLASGSTIIEPTSGNTGIGLALVAAVRGYRLILTMPETMSVERRRLLKAFGAEVFLTPGQEGMQGAIEKAKELAREIPCSYIPQQFDNPANPAAHKENTGPEIWKDMEGYIDIFVAGVGTGGTITGVGEFCKEQKKDIKVIAVEPAASPVLSGGQPGRHNIQGIGAGFVPAILNRQVIDDVITVQEEQAYAACRELSKTEGLLVGISSGAAVWAAVQVGLRKEYQGKNIVVVLPDGGERYLSVRGLFV